MFLGSTLDQANNDLSTPDTTRNLKPGDKIVNPPDEKRKFFILLALLVPLIVLCTVSFIRFRSGKGLGDLGFILAPTLAPTSQPTLTPTSIYAINPSTQSTGNSGSKPETTPNGTTVPNETITFTATVTPTATASLTSSPTPTTKTVVTMHIDINDGSYSQSTINLKIGVEYHIIISNNGNHKHSLTSTIMDTGTLSQSQSKTIVYTPTTAGTYSFHCTAPCGPFHSDMQSGYKFVIS